MSEKRYEVDGVEVERYMLVFGDEGTRIVDNQTGKELYAIELVDLLNELSTNCSQLQEENEQLEKGKMEALSLLREEIDKNEQLKSYIDTIFEGNTHICKKLDIEDVQFYCQRNRDYRFPTCTYAKCFDEENLIEVKEEIRKCFDE